MVTRRTVNGAAAALLAAMVAPRLALGSDARSRLLPPRLRNGDTVGLVCPAGFIADRFGLDEVMQTVRAMGLVPRPAPHLLARNGYLAGTDQERAADLQAMFADDEVRAIFAVRGGWGSQRILPLLDYDAIRARPKLVIGSSDITALHMALAAKAGLPGIHGPNAAHSWPVATWQNFRNLAFDADTPSYAMPDAKSPLLGRREWPLRTFRAGKAKGRLLGGNLSVLSAMVGTPWLPDFEGAILFLEDVNEAEYRIDRMLTQLSQSGLLSKLAGVVFGQCTNCGNPGAAYGNFTIYEVLDHHLSSLGVPAFQGAAFGHISAQVSLPIAVEAEIDAGAGTIEILEPVVS